MKCFIFLLVLTVYQTSLAQIDRKGNGGIGVDCGNSLELFDIYEGRILNQNIPIEKANSFQEQSLSFADHLTAMTADVGDEPFHSNIQYVIQSLKFLPSGVGLMPTSDADNFIYPKNCDLVQILNYKNDGFIYVDSDLWSRLSETGKAAAILHEAIYKYFRTPDPLSGVIVDGDQDSVRTRRVVSHLIAGKALEPVRNTYLTKNAEMTWVCSNSNQSEPSTSFAVYESPSETTVEFRFLRGARMISNASITLPWPFKDFITTERVRSIVDWDVDVSIQNIGGRKPDFIIEITGGNYRTRQALDCRKPPLNFLKQ